MGNDNAGSPDDDSIETERRFLVRDASIVEGSSWKLITQAYYPAPDGHAVRVRLVQHPQDDGWVGETAFIGVKGPRSGGQRWEEEFPLKKLADAKALIQASPDVVQKRRYSVIDSDATWEVDIFLGDNIGLVIAELEGKEDTESSEADQSPPSPKKDNWIWAVEPPAWTLREITFDTNYNNENLAVRPVRRWAIDPEPDADDYDADWLDG